MLAFALDQSGVQIRLRESLTAHNAAQEGHVVGQAGDVHLAQSGIQLGQGLLAVVPPHDELGDHRVVIGGDLIAFAHAAVHPHGGDVEGVAGGCAIHIHLAGCGQELVGRVLSANAGLDGVATNGQFVLLFGQWLASGHAQLPFHQVEAGDGFGHGVLDLQAGVHLHEVEPADPHAPRGGVAPLGRPCGGDAILLNNELDCPSAYIAHAAGGGNGGCAHLGAALGSHAGGRGFFQYLLVAALHRAVALEQVHVVAMGVTKHLDFDVARSGHIAFHQHMVIAKAGQGFALARRQSRFEVGRSLHGPHALAATARAGLDQHGVAHAVSLLFQEGRVLLVAVVARHQRYVGLFHQGLGGRLAAHGGNG